MKKLFASILCLGMIFGATGCTSGGDDTYEIIDGQQRTISICQYLSLIHI